MNTKHTPGPWWVSMDTLGNPNVLTNRDHGGCEVGSDMGCFIATGIGDHTEQRTRGNEFENACLISAAPDLLQELKKRTDNAEQSAFEDWLERKTPSGDAESVHRQWKESSDFQTYADEWRHALDAIAKATGASHVSQQ